MLDLLLIRATQGGNPEIVYDSQKKRFKSLEIVDKSIELDKKWKEGKDSVIKYLLARSSADTVRYNYNLVEKKITEKKKASKGEDPCTELILEKEKLAMEIKSAENLAEELLTELLANYSKVGNIVHESVPIDDNEDNNAVIRTWGTPDTSKVIDGKPGKAHHHEILKWIGGFDPERGNKIAGHRGYFLKGYGVLLNQALVHYGMKFLAKRGYTPVQPPYFMKKEIMAETAELADFDEQLYKVEGEELFYLIATAEQPISTMFRGEWIEKNELPMKFSGISPCFRKEAGAHGKDTWGIFRVHQFEKVEQFCITLPEDSWKMHEEMIAVSEEYYQSLNLPYRVISIVSGALNNAAAKKYDLEAWFPGYGTFRELVSCSNCTDYQSRSAEIRLRTDKKQTGDVKVYVHMLNGTLCATERTLCCILENYQTEEGVIVPEPLREFVGTDFIPYLKDKLPGYIKEEEKEKKGKKGEVKKGEKTEGKKSEGKKKQNVKQEGTVVMTIEQEVPTKEAQPQVEEPEVKVTINQEIPEKIEDENNK